METIKKYLGVDWGEKRIGLATADGETNLALPLKTVATLGEVLSAVKEEETDVIIVGAPKKMSGAEANNPLWLDFVQRLREKSACRVELIDERLSSAAADSLEGEAGVKAERDEIAATLILQDYLDRN